MTISISDFYDVENIYYEEDEWFDDHDLPFDFKDSMTQPYSIVYDFQPLPFELFA